MKTTKKQAAINGLRSAVKAYEKTANESDSIFYMTAVANAGLRVKKAAKRLLDLLSQD